MHLRPPPPSPPPPHYEMFQNAQSTYTFAVTGVMLMVAVLVLVFCVAVKVCSLSSAAAKEKESDTKKMINVEVEGKGLNNIAKLAHVLAIVVAGVIAVAVMAVMADGTSVIKLKDPQYLPIITNPDLRYIAGDTYGDAGRNPGAANKSTGFNHRADQLLGPTYGIGLHHDQSGAQWTDYRAGKTLDQLVHDLGLPVIVAALPSVIATDDLKHPVSFLSCDDLLTAGLTAVSFGYIAFIVAVLLVILHSVALTGAVAAKPIKMVAGLIWLTLTAGFAIVVYLAVGIYNATWECHNIIVPEIKISDHFEFNYGMPFAIVGFVSALLIFCTQLTMTSTKDGDAAPALVGVATKTLGGLTVGIIIGAVGAVIVMGGLNAFEADMPADPNVNPCEGKKPYHLGNGDNYFANVDCMHDQLTQTLEQAGGNVTKGYRGLMDAADREPIKVPYSETDLCPVNVHWHLGAEHLSVNQYDDHGKGPCDAGGHRRKLAADECDADDEHRRGRNLAGNVRRGNRCHHYDSHDTRFTTEYDWQFCTGMHVGETYEVHWPHSAAGACGTDWQYQSPFYDGVFCRDGVITVAPLNTYETIGVQGQIYTIINDEQFYHDDMIGGMIVDEDHGVDMSYYTGSTTGTTRTNAVCSRYAPITWQVDRKCHLISASSFDKMCQDMLGMKDDMSSDVHAHGARITTADHITADNQYYTGIDNSHRK